MAVNNSLQSRSGGKPKFSVAIQTPMYQKLVNDTLGDPDRARRFVAAISSAVAVNPSLQECDAGTVLTAALLGESLNLSPSPQLGQYYMVPYKDKKRGTVAQFQLGYKGYIQLAERSGQYLDIDAFPVTAEDKAASDLEVLATVESEFAEAVKIKYLEHLDLNEALMERSRLQERANRLREYEAQRAAQAANLAEEQREAEATRGAEQTPDPAANAAQAGTWEPGGGEAVEETIYLLRFECQVTKDQAAELSRWLKERNISYRRI